MNGTNRKSTNPHLIYGVVIVIIVAIFSILLFKANKPGSLKLQVGNNQLEMTLEGDTLSIKKILDKLLKDKESARESGALLREFGHFYQPTDPGLVDEIEQQGVESEVSKRLRALLYNLSGPFERSSHTFYNVQDVEMVDAIEKLGFDHPVSKELRALLIYRKGPFEERAKEILLSVPSGDSIPKGRAAACKGNEFYRREIRVFNAQRTRSVTVYVSGSFPCPEINQDKESDIGNLVQISYTDMKDLIGDSPIIGKERGFAEILIDTQ